MRQQHVIRRPFQRVRRECGVTRHVAAPKQKHQTIRFEEWLKTIQQRLLDPLGEGHEEGRDPREGEAPRTGTSKRRRERAEASRTPLQEPPRPVANADRQGCLGRGEHTRRDPHDHAAPARAEPREPGSRNAGDDLRADGRIAAHAQAGRDDQPQGEQAALLTTDSRAPTPRRLTSPGGAARERDDAVGRGRRRRRARGAGGPLRKAGSSAPARGWARGTS